jgi:hypothetical protein
MGERGWICANLGAIAVYWRSGLHGEEARHCSVGYDSSPTHHVAYDGR